MRNTKRVVASLVLAIVIVGACSDSGRPTNAAGNSTTSLPATTTTALVTTTTGPPGESLPLELRGVWRTTLPNGDSATLNLQADTYRIARNSDSGGGTASVDGDVLTFTTSLCDGPGAYKWSLQNDQLTLTVVGTDPCPRSEVLQGVTFVRMP